MDKGRIISGGKINGKTLKQQLQERIVTDEKILRQPSKPISKVEVEILKLHVVLPEMVKRGWTDGAAISAIQIDVPVQVCFYDFELKFLKTELKRGPRGLPLDAEGKEREIDLKNDIEVKRYGPTLLLNPFIVPGSAKKLVRLQNEGCLSLPNRRYSTWRFDEVTVYNAWDQTEIKATGFMAHVLQHEIDHMNGVLCCDRTDLERNGPCPCGAPLKAKKCCAK